MISGNEDVLLVQPQNSGISKGKTKEFPDFRQRGRSVSAARNSGISWGRLKTFCKLLLINGNSL